MYSEGKENGRLQAWHVHNIDIKSRDTYVTFRLTVIREVTRIPSSHLENYNFTGPAHIPWSGSLRNFKSPGTGTGASHISEERVARIPSLWVKNHIQYPYGP